MYFCFQDEKFGIKFPQEARCFILKPGTHHIKVSPDKKKHRDIYVRLLSKSSFEVENLRWAAKCWKKFALFQYK